MFTSARRTNDLTPAQGVELMDGIRRAVAASYATNPCTRTEAETARRARMCVEIALQLRGDVQWGVHRICDYLPRYLRAELNGEAWKPDERALWVPDEGAPGGEVTGNR